MGADTHLPSVSARHSQKKLIIRVYGSAGIDMNGIKGRDGNTNVNMFGASDLSA